MEGILALYNLICATTTVANEKWSLIAGGHPERDFCIMFEIYAKIKRIHRGVV